MFMVPRGEFAPRRGRPPLYPIGYLAVGESMFFPGVTAHKMRNIFRHHQKLEFERHTEVRDGVIGLLVTRVAEADPDRRPGRIPKYPLRKMKVGESLYVPGETAASMWAKWKNIRDMKFKSRAVMKHGVKGVKVWRIE